VTIRIFSFNIGDFCRLHARFQAKQQSHAGIDQLEFLSDWG